MEIFTFPISRIGISGERIFRALNKDRIILLKVSQKNGDHSVAVIVGINDYLTLIESLETPPTIHLRSFKKLYTESSIAAYGPSRKKAIASRTFRNFPACTLTELQNQSEKILYYLEGHEGMLLFRGLHRIEEPVGVIVNIDRFRSILAYHNTPSDLHYKHLKLSEKIDKGEYETFEKVTDSCSFDD